MARACSQAPDVCTRERIQSVADAVRRRVLEHTLTNNGGYLSQACSSAEILATLYLRVMRLGMSTAPSIPRSFPGVPGADNPDAFTGAGYNGPKGADLDRFIFSPVHYALVLYSVLIELGRLGPNALDEFNRDGSTVELIGAEHSPGHEVTAGSLAQAISQAGGIALARRLRGDSGRVWVFMSDGEFQEGQTWEAFAALAYHRLGNLGVYVDANAQQCDGPLDLVMNIEPLADRLRAFGAEVHEVDGHDPDALAAPAESVEVRDRPLVVIARTDPCRGIERLRERAPKLHYVRFKSEQEFATYQTLLNEMREEGL
ncbi:Transketolase domain-containing protein [Thiorhodococcus drewsii AZ1]|uniref:Transketolase domain-containing protein n=1 Tax=Thiorhodococcus drewsii AZ1 TaxID=765913 RepID=G2E1I2_9GAMM|nr:transketolase [Thiorhodococcus drewsii]EGV31279.1 Transketolase domain-containing protein [Thiorhodococcus drewsii AZ1]